MKRTLLETGIYTLQVTDARLNVHTPRTRHAGKTFISIELQPIHFPNHKLYVNASPHYPTFQEILNRIGFDADYINTWLLNQVNNTFQEEGMYVLVADIIGKTFEAKVLGSGQRNEIIF